MSIFAFSRRQAGSFIKDVRVSRNLSDGRPLTVKAMSVIDVSGRVFSRRKASFSVIPVCSRRSVFSDVGGSFPISSVMEEPWMRLPEMSSTRIFAAAAASIRRPEDVPVMPTPARESSRRFVRGSRSARSVMNRSFRLFRDRFRLSRREAGIFFSRTGNAAAPMPLLARER